MNRFFLSFLAVLVCFAINPAKAVQLSGHRISYSVALESRKQNSDVVAVTGDSDYIFRDTCKGWTTTDNTNMLLNYESGRVYEIKSTTTSFEDKNGNDFEFQVQRRNPVEMEYSGKVKTSLFLRKREALFDISNAPPQKFDLGRDVMFPVQFIQLLLDAAERGDNYVNRRVFDATEVQGASDYSAVIGKPILLSEGIHPLLAGKRAWPVHLAFFEDNQETGEIMPDYEVSFTLYENGVSDAIAIDYGDFVVRFKSKDFEYLESSCK